MFHIYLPYNNKTYYILLKTFLRGYLPQISYLPYYYIERAWYFLNIKIHVPVFNLRNVNYD